MSNLLEIMSTETAATENIRQQTVPASVVVKNSLPAYGIDINGLKNNLKNNGVYDATLGEVDLGDLEWTYDASHTKFQSEAIPSLKPTASSSSIPNVYIQGYTTTTPNNTNSSSYNKVVSIGSVNRIVIIKDTSLGTDVESFKTAMAGKKFYYELATPTSEHPEFALRSELEALKSDMAAMAEIMEAMI